MTLLGYCLYCFYMLKYVRFNVKNNKLVRDYFLGKYYFGCFIKIIKTNLNT